MDTIKRRYYSIGQIASLLNVYTSTLRFWEQEFKQIKPKRSKKGKRKYTQKDLKIVLEVYYLVKVELYTIEGAKRQLEL